MFSQALKNMFSGYYNVHFISLFNLGRILMFAFAYRRWLVLPKTIESHNHYHYSIMSVFVSIIGFRHFLVWQRRHPFHIINSKNVAITHWPDHRCTSTWTQATIFIGPELFLKLFQMQMLRYHSIYFPSFKLMANGVFSWFQVNDIIRIAKVNYVVMNLLANGHKKESKSAPEFDFSIHKYFPTIKQN